jgi:hypothetical protein
MLESKEGAEFERKEFGWYPAYTKSTIEPKSESNSLR